MMDANCCHPAGLSWWETAILLLLLVKIFSYQAELLPSNSGAHQIPMSHSRIVSALQIPADMFARHPNTLMFAIGAMQLGQMPLHDLEDFQWSGSREQFTSIQVMPDLTKYPGIALGCPANHQAICTGECEYLSGFLGCLDVTICKDRNGDALADIPNCVVFNQASKPVGTGSPVARPGRRYRIVPRCLRSSPRFFAVDWARS